MCTLLQLSILSNLQFRHIELNCLGFYINFVLLMQVKNSRSMNIKNVLKQKGFTSAHAEKLGLQLDEVSQQLIHTFIHNRGGIDGNWDSILTDIINHWLNNDVEKSWKKLAEALINCDYTGKEMLYWAHHQIQVFDILTLSCSQVINVI